MSSAWFADISMESLLGLRPVRPTVSSRPSMVCFRQQSARPVDMHALKPFARTHRGKPLGEHFRIGKRGAFTEEPQLTAVIRRGQLFEEPAPKQSREHAHG